MAFIQKNDTVRLTIALYPASLCILQYLLKVQLHEEPSTFICQVEDVKTPDRAVSVEDRRFFPEYPQIIEVLDSLIDRFHYLD